MVGEHSDFVSVSFLHWHCGGGDDVNVADSYYLNDLLVLMGYTDPNFKGKLNVGLTCWSLVCGVAVALVVKKFRRRTMYLVCTCSLLCVYVGWTISMERFLTTKASVAAKLTIFFIFAYSPCYNIGYNALTYSTLFPVPLIS